MRIPKVHTKNGRYYYVHANRWHALTRVDEGETALYLALADITSDRPASLGQLMQQYLARGMTELAEPTRKSYRNIIEARLLRAKAATDSEHNVLGHRSDMLRVYRRADRTRPVR